MGSVESLRVESEGRGRREKNMRKNKRGGEVDGETGEVVEKGKKEGLG